MDISIPLPFAALGAAITLAIGYLVALINTDDRHRKLAEKREVQIRREYTQYRSEVKEHFGQSSKLFSQVTEQYRQLYLHMSQGARLLGNAPPTPMLKKLEKEQRAEAKHRARAEPQLTEPALDNALVELRDDLNQFKAQLTPVSAKYSADAEAANAANNPSTAKNAASNRSTTSGKPTAIPPRTNSASENAKRAVVWRHLNAASPNEKTAENSAV